MSPILFDIKNSLSSSNKYLYLDRDGVLIEPVMRGNIVSSARCFEDIKVCNDAVSFCEKLKSRGFTLVVISNQPDLGRGLINMDFIKTTNQIISNAIDIDYFVYCPHLDFEQCSCRKPKLGMINYFRANYCPNPIKEIMVGDRIVDFDFACSAKIQFILKQQPYSFFGDGKRLLGYDLAFTDLRKAVDQLML
jgi:D-glycero-D-manno-heptose 1,7-bisphosphate phosphatase